MEIAIGEHCYLQILLNNMGRSIEWLGVTERFACMFSHRYVTLCFELNNVLNGDNSGGYMRN